jgi:thiol:disulfide interchange protein DsbD
MAVGMCGLFSLRLPRFVYAVTPRQESIPGALLFGVMTAILSTPCTAPLMGGAAAWAVKQPMSVALLTFAAIGAGMALPYFILSAYPALVNRMPRTGPASELIKQIMGLLMLAAGMFFIGSGLSGFLATPPDPPTLLYWWLVAAPVIGAGLWLAYRTLRITRRAALRTAFVALGILLTAGGAYGAVQLSRRGPIAWVYYTPERFAQAQREGKVVVLDFTAEWCLNCKVLERAVLHRSEVIKALTGPSVQPMRVDLTGNNVMGNRKLGEVGRVTIPALVIYAPGGRQTLNSDAYTADQVLRAISAARGR